MFDFLFNAPPHLLSPKFRVRLCEKEARISKVSWLGFCRLLWRTCCLEDFCAVVLFSSSSPLSSSSPSPLPIALPLPAFPLPSCLPLSPPSFSRQRHFAWLLLFTLETRVPRASLVTVPSRDVSAFWFPYPWVWTGTEGAPQLWQLVVSAEW